MVLKSMKFQPFARDRLDGFNHGCTVEQDFECLGIAGVHDERRVHHAELKSDKPSVLQDGDVIHRIRCGQQRGACFIDAGNERLVRTGQTKRRAQEVVLHDDSAAAQSAAASRATHAGRSAR